MKAWKNFLLLTLTVCLVFAVGCAKADPTAHPSPSTDIGSGDPDVQYRYEIKGACDFFVGSEATADSLDYSNVKAVRLNSNGVEYPVEADFSALSQSQEEGIRKRIAFFKKYRRLLQCGKTYRVGNAFSKERFEAYGLLAVSENKASALALVAAEKGRGNGTPCVCLKGLEEGAAYTVSAFERDGGKREILTASGEFLTSGRIPLQIFCDGSLSGGALFAWLIVEKVKKNKGA